MLVLKTQLEIEVEIRIKEKRGGFLGRRIGNVT